MEGLKSHRVLAVAAVLLVLFGAFSLSLAFPNQAISGDKLIPLGSAYYVISVNGFPGLKLQVQYVVESGGAVNVYILTPEEYSIFSATYYAPGSLYSEVNRTAGSFSYTFTAFGPYYVTFSHSTGVTGNQQLMHLTSVVSGVHPLFLAGGVAMLVLAVVLVVVARRWRRASRRTGRVAPRAKGALLYAPRGPR